MEAMMRGARLLFPLAMAHVWITGLPGAENLYRDPQNRFTIGVPPGWSVSTPGNTLQIVKGSAYTNVMVLDASGSAREMVTAVGRQIVGQWKNLQTVGSPDLPFAGQTGAASMFVGFNPGGVQAFMAIYAAVIGRQAFVLAQSAPMAEYKSLQAEMDGIAGSLMPASPASPGRPAAPAAPLPDAAGANYEAQDRSISFRIPAGWKAGTPINQGVILHVIERQGGPEKIFVATGMATVNSLPELTRQSIQLVTQQILPGVQVAGVPRTLQFGGANVAEINYKGVAGAGGEVSWWHLVSLQGNRYIGVMGGGQAAQSSLVQEHCQAVFRSVRLGKVTENASLARAIVGHWTFYERGRVTGGSSSKEITFYPNGRYEYKAAAYVPNVDLPVDVNPITEMRGTYRVEGNTIYYQPDGGAPGTFTIELLQGGQALNIGGQIFLRG